MKRHTSISITLLAGASILVHAMLSSFALSHTPQGAASSEPAPAVTTTVDDTKAGEPQPRRWLMREGSLLVQARGVMERDPRSGAWQFIMRHDGVADIQQAMGLLPCALLGEMVRMTESLEGRSAIFEVTGQIFVYRGRNYLLPTIAPQLVEYSAATTEAPAPDTSAETSIDAAAPTSDAGSDSAEDIIEDLESAVGSLARSAPPVTDGTASAQPGAAANSDTLVREQTMLLSRRGQVTRLGSGAWMFVFDADAQGLADPPMILMPCLVLEHLEQRVWRSGARLPVLISGRTYVFEDRNYLLPTAFQIARERTPITP